MAEGDEKAMDEELYFVRFVDTTMEMSMGSATSTWQTVTGQISIKIFKN